MEALVKDLDQFRRSGDSADIRDRSVGIGLFDKVADMVLDGVVGNGDGIVVNSIYLFRHKCINQCFVCVVSVYRSFGETVCDILFVIFSNNTNGFWLS